MEFMHRWISLFDENKFQVIRNEPDEFKNVTMLFLGIQSEFKKIESLLNNKISSLKGAHSKQKITIENESSNKECKSRDSNTPPREYQINSEMLMKSPTLGNHRRPKTKRLNKISNDSKISFSKPRPMDDISNSLHTPLSKKPMNIEEDDIFDASIVEVTPNIKAISISKSKSKLFSSKRKKKVLKSTTLTQTFSAMSTKKNETKDSLMDIEEILDEIENTGDLHLTSHNEKDCSNTIQKNISPSFFLDFDKLPQRPKSPKKKFVYKETVRGNERKKLKGWSCKECEKFYAGMNLPEEELERLMNDCSKHRSKFKPVEETIPGFWDMSIPSTPEHHKTPPTSPASSQDSLGNESTIFGFHL